MDVPFSTMVVIPADKALKSKDLWRSIGQKQLFQLQRGPGMPYIPLDSRAPSPDPALLERIRLLEEENRQLRLALESKNTHRDDRIDALLTFLQSGAVALPGIATQRGPQAPQVASADVPTYIPTVITPDGAETRIEPKRAESESAAVSGASDKLRNLKRKSAAGA